MEHLCLQLLLPLELYFQEGFHLYKAEVYIPLWRIVDLHLL
jgi:hypothetical protein